MPIYEYRCQEHGSFEVIRSSDKLADTMACPACGQTSPRMMCAPSIRRSDNRGFYSMMDHAEKSRHEPEVVSSIPRSGNPRPARVAKMTPQLAGLPRP